MACKSAMMPPIFQKMPRIQTMEYWWYSMLKILLILVHIRIWYVFDNHVCIVRNMAITVVVRNIPPPVLLIIAPYGLGLPLLLHSLTSDSLVTWPMDIVVDNDHMTHLYNSYIVVEITPPPLSQSHDPMTHRSHDPLIQW
jgi:hypothetical protein